MAIRDIQSVDDLIFAAGGVGVLAQKLGISHSTVSGWKAEGTIPATRVGQIHALLGIRLDRLVDLATKPQQRRSEAA